MDVEIAAKAARQVDVEIVVGTHAVVVGMNVVDTVRCMAIAWEWYVRGLQAVIVRDGKDERMVSGVRCQCVIGVQLSQLGVTLHQHLTSRCLARSLHFQAH